MTYYGEFPPDLVPCPCCGRNSYGLTPLRLPANFYPWLGACPSCGEEQYVSAYNVTVPCEHCDYVGMRDTYKDNRHQPNEPEMPQ